MISSVDGGGCNADLFKEPGDKCSREEHEKCDTPTEVCSGMQNRKRGEQNDPQLYSQLWQQNEWIDVGREFPICIGYECECRDDAELIIHLRLFIVNCQIASHLWFVFNHQNLFHRCIFFRSSPTGHSLCLRSFAILAAFLWTRLIACT